MLMLFNMVTMLYFTITQLFENNFFNPLAGHHRKINADLFHLFFMKVEQS